MQTTHHVYRNNRLNTAEPPPPKSVSNKAPDKPCLAGAHLDPALLSNSPKPTSNITKPSFGNTSISPTRNWPATRHPSTSKSVRNLSPTLTLNPNHSGTHTCKLVLTSAANSAWPSAQNPADLYDNSAGA